MIDAILATANLETISRKKIREGLEKALGGKDLSEQKVSNSHPLWRLCPMSKAVSCLPPPPVSAAGKGSPDVELQKAIKDLIELRFDKINQEARSTGNMPTPPSAPATSDEAARPKRERSETNGHDEDEDEDHVDGEIEVSLEDEPVKKKQKRAPSLVDEDARLAAELQAQENRLARGRTTRGGGTSKPSKTKKKTPKKKGAARIKGDDDSDVDSSEASGVPKEKKKAGGGFQKPFNLSYALGDLCGATQVRQVSHASRGASS